MREAHAVVQGQTARNLPGIRCVEIRRDVAESWSHVEIQLGILRGLAYQHIRVSIPRSTAPPITEDHRTVDGSVAGLLVPGALPVEAELRGVRPPDFVKVIRYRSQSQLGIAAASQIESSIEHVGNTIAEGGHLRKDDVVKIGVAEKKVKVKTERSPLDLG